MVTARLPVYALTCGYLQTVGILDTVVARSWVGVRPEAALDEYLSRDEIERVSDLIDDLRTTWDMSLGDDRDTALRLQERARQLAAEIEASIRAQPEPL